MGKRGSPVTDSTDELTDDQIEQLMDPIARKGNLGWITVSNVNLLSVSEAMQIVRAITGRGKPARLDIIEQNWGHESGRRVDWPDSSPREGWIKYIDSEGRPIGLAVQPRDRE